MNNNCKFSECSCFLMGMKTHGRGDLDDEDLIVRSDFTCLM